MSELDPKSLDQLGAWRRSHLCGELRGSDAGKDVLLAGWVHSVRDHGGLLFVDLRDKTGFTQVVFSPQGSEGPFERAGALRSEWVIAIKGLCKNRGEDLVNPKIPTGEIEVAVDEIKILNKSTPPPFPIEDQVDTTEEVRLKHRVQDLRRPIMQKRLLLRHKVSLAVRNYMDKKGFVEVETPMLLKSTPEGARDFLVPSRLYPGKFYALPQSPQILKQLLMVAGTDKYFQLARCFRDEDLRADRQYEFTQIDFEMSFIGEEDIFGLMEGMISDIFRAAEAAGFPWPLPKAPFPRITYAESMAKYGTDKPDIRYAMVLSDISPIVAQSGFKVFKEAIAKGSTALSTAIPGGGALSRKEVDELIAFCQKEGAGGMAYMKVTDKGLESNITKFFSEAELKALQAAVPCKVGDLLVFIVEPLDKARRIMDVLRRHLAQQLKLIPKDKIDFCWITEFPLFLKDDKGKLTFAHNPFSGVKDEDLPLIESDPLKVRSRAYDLVGNGFEISSGSIRNHNADLLEKIFGMLGHSKEEMEKRFGFMLDGLRAGAPPHGGFAPGVDRIVMLLAGETNIREVTAFPKTQKGTDLFTGTPTEVDLDQLKILGLKLGDAEKK